MNFFVFVLMLRCHRASIWVIQYRGLWEGRVQYQYALCSSASRVLPRPHVSEAELRDASNTVTHVPLWYTVRLCIRSSVF